MTSVISVLSLFLSLSFIATTAIGQQNGCQELEASFPAITISSANVQYGNDSIGKDAWLNASSVN